MMERREGTTEGAGGPAGLAARLRAETAEAHRSAERAPYIRALAQAQVDRATYVRQLSAFARIYAALETGLATHASDAVAGRVFLPELFRSEAIARDLAFLGGASPVRSAAAESYAARLVTLSTDAPELLVAHAYVRYLGDLSGGQALRRLVARTLGLTGDDGLSFFDFPAIPDHAAFKNDFRARLDALPVTTAQADALVAEAGRAFAFNEAVFRDLWPDEAARVSA